MRAEGHRLVLAREPVGPAEMGDGLVVDAEDLGDQWLGFVVVGGGPVGLPLGDPRSPGARAQAPSGGGLPDTAGQFLLRPSALVPGVCEGVADLVVHSPTSSSAPRPGELFRRTGDRAGIGICSGHDAHAAAVLVVFRPAPRVTGRGAVAAVPPWVLSRPPGWGLSACRARARGTFAVRSTPTAADAQGGAAMSYDH